MKRGFFGGLIPRHLWAPRERFENSVASVGRFAKRGKRPPRIVLPAYDRNIRKRVKRQHRKGR